MATWNDYKNHVRGTNPEIGKDIEEIEERAKIVSAMIDQRHNLNLSQRDLAEMCGIPHSSVICYFCLFQFIFELFCSLCTHF